MKKRFAALAAMASADFLFRTSRARSLVLEQRQTRFAGNPVGCEKDSALTFLPTYERKRVDIFKPLASLRTAFTPHG